MALLLSIPEVCAHSKLGRSSVYQAINSGELRAVKRGSRTLVREEDLRRFVELLPAFEPKAAAGSDGQAAK